MVLSKQVRKLVGVVAVIIVAWLGYGQVQDGSQSSAPTPSASPATASENTASQDTGGFDFSGVYSEAADQILSAFQSERSDMWIEAGGKVQRVLADDSEGSRHQRFIVQLPNDHTILIAHNIDLAQRVPVKPGDPVSFFGEFEWNDRGGVIHWTHHDPGNRREGGWIRHKSTTYR